MNMKFSLPELFASANPYRDWFLILILLLLSAVGVAILDARLFLSATGQPAHEGQELSAIDLKKSELARAAALLKDREDRFNTRR